MNIDHILKPVGLFMGCWGLFVSFLLTFAPAWRFASPQWQFIASAPGGHVSLGIGLLLSALLLTGACVAWKRGLVPLFSYIIGAQFLALAFTMGMSALGADSGG